MLTGRPHSTRYKVGDIVKSREWGDFEIVEIEHARRILCRSVETGYEIYKQASHIDIGSIKDPYHPSILGVAFLGSGKYNSVNRKPAYQKWKNMLTRCYDVRYQVRNPTYFNCKVCDEWLNFQNFAEWCEIEGYSGQSGIELDKDIKIKGNKIYSPEACMFVTRKENHDEAHCYNRTLMSPEGEVVEIYNISDFAKQNGLNQSHLSAVFLGRRNKHKGWTRVST